MPPQHGEEVLVNVLADIHYYFQTPTPRPRSHRFEKSSYLYIYQDATQNTARLEIANNPGTEDQDAFAASLGNVHIHHSTEFPTLCTVTVDGLTGAPEHGASQHDWLLPSDQNEWRRIHTIDIYFWTLDDANQFLDTARHVLTNNQVETDRDVAVEQTDQPLSSVVQQLENVAVSDPAYQNGQTRDSQANSTAIAASPVSTQATPETLSFPPPPPPPAAPAASTDPTPQERQPSPEKPTEPENTAPLPYNPAAPAAPEFIKHREKTPPPPEEGELPYNAHQSNIGMSSFAPPPTSTPGMSSFAPPPSSTPGMPYRNPAQAAPGYASPPPSAGLSHAHTFSMGSGSALQSPTLPTYQQSFLTGQAVPSSGMSFAPPPQDPNAHLYAQGYGMQQAQMGYQNPSPYEQQPPQPLQRSTTEYDIHSQVYRPTMDEVHSHAQKTARKSMKAPGQRPHAIEDKAHKMESGVNRFLKRLEKKIG